MFSFTELREWLHGAGFVDVEGFDREGRPISLDSRRMVVSARRST